MAAESVRVLIVEDHRVLAEGLELALSRHADLRVVGLAGTVAEAVRLASQQRPQVVLMDYYLPDGTGAQAALAVRQRVPDAAVVILTAEASEEALLAAVEAGACGYLLKSLAAAQVVQGVRRAAEGEMLIPAATLAGLVVRQRQRADRESERARLRGLLTPREREVLQLMVQGLDNRAIAARLVVSFTTVRGYVQSVLDKLGAHSKLEAVARASEYRLLER
ncbi:MAG: response regulator transcription factor [Chloroflexi bacterium]|nr:response regulator transcription factor [Chloroflexota bacterium]